MAEVEKRADDCGISSCTLSKDQYEDGANVYIKKYVWDGKICLLDNLLHRITDSTTKYEELVKQLCDTPLLFEWLGRLSSKEKKDTKSGEVMYQVLCVDWMLAKHLNKKEESLKWRLLDCGDRKQMAEDVIKEAGALKKEIPADMADKYDEVCSKLSSIIELFESDIRSLQINIEIVKKLSKKKIKDVAKDLRTDVKDEYVLYCLEPFDDTEKLDQAECSFKDTVDSLSPLLAKEQSEKLSELCTKKIADIFYMYDMQHYYKVSQFNKMKETQKGRSINLRFREGEGQEGPQG